MENQKDEMKKDQKAITVRRWIVTAVVLLAAAAVLTVWLLIRGSSHSSGAGRPVPAPAGEAVPSTGAPSTGTTPRPGELVITLSPDKLENAGIKTEVVTEQTGPAYASAVGLRATGTVASNAYKETPVFPIAGGIIRQINVELGNKVARGQTLAAIFSGELADAQAAYLKMLAEVEEHHQHHRRTIELVEIGAVSREELEQATTKYKTAQANLASARERLILLGMSERQLDELRTAQKPRKPLLAVESPASGTLIARAVNVGEVVMSGKEMFRVADLSTVWVLAQIYERDFQAVNVGTPAVVTTSAYPGRTFNGRVSYIDPRVDPQTRTAQVRIELANPREMLKLGMFVDVNFGGAAAAQSSGQPVATVPRAAIQTIGAKQVVYAATDRSGSFVQREVSVGAETNGLVSVYSGVSAGERVATEGSFLLRAESLKLNPAQSMSPASQVQGSEFRLSGSPGPASNPEPGTLNAEPTGGVQTATVSVNETGFQPSTINLKRAVPARITFVRDVEATCARSVVIAGFNIKRDLPFKEPVVVEFTPAKRGVFKFTCGMEMLEGKIVVR
ncbi:MAG TPA: efflux RND transporter periplasmic adaptor subunit [Blastocatellia bacterium]